MNENHMLRAAALDMAIRALNGQAADHAEVTKYAEAFYVFLSGNPPKQEASNGQ